MKNKFLLILVALLIFGSFGSVFAQTAPNLVKNSDFAKFAKEWPNWPFDWNIKWKGGDGYEPVKTENGRCIGYAENLFNFTLAQNVTGLSKGKYSLSADFRLNPDSVAEDITMSVYAGNNLLKSKSIRADLFAKPKETDVRFELDDIQVSSAAVRIEFTATNVKKYVGIDNVVFCKN